MPEGTGIGVYPFGEVGYARENDEVSSTYLGRHLTFTEAQITGHEHDFPTKGHPVVVNENIVGVSFTTATAVGDQVTIDTEGIWLLSVVALNPASVAVVAGDELFINKSTAIISNNDNKNTHCHFGYALGGVNAGQTAIISVKVHWDPDDALESVGVSGTPEVNALASVRFREYHYEATGGGYPKGDYLALTISTTICTSAQALRRVLQWQNDPLAWVSGYAAVGEFDLVVTAGVGGATSMKTSCAIFLTSSMDLTGINTMNFQASWIRIQEYATSHLNQINNLIELNDQDGGDYPYAANGGRLFSTSGDMATNHVLRFMCNGDFYYILCSDTFAGA